MGTYGRTGRAGLAALTAGVLALTGCTTQQDTEPGSERSASPGRSAGAPGRADDGAPSAGWDRSPDSVAAVGDSITRAFDACSVLEDCPRVSWATGSDPAVDSVAARLLRDPARNSWNLARSGAVMADLPAQMERAAARSPELVTVLVGANDACRPTEAAMTGVEEFRADFEDSLAALRRKAPEAQVYVMSVPDLKRLWSQGREVPEALKVWKLGICPTMLADPLQDDADAQRRRARVDERVRGYNTALREVCEADRACRWDGGAVYGFPFTQRELSRWDWFHPGIEGQRELAALAHRQITGP